MPNIWTHILFTEDVCDRLERQDIINTSSRFLNLGAQGPDPFFYYNFWPMFNNHDVPEVGMKLHKEKCGSFLLNIIQSGKSERNQSQAYILGFITHHILDRFTHPYIHYRAGYEGNKHQVFEVIIDTIMLDRYRDLKTWKTPAHRQIQLSKKEAKALAQWLEQEIYIQFPQVVQSVPSNYIVQSLLDIALAQRLLFDPSGWKNQLLGSLVSSFSHRPIEKEADYLNETNQEWKHSATGEILTASFINLYEEAFAEACNIIKRILQYWSSTNEELLAELEVLVGDISYDTGKPLSLELENYYSDPIV
ncbi:zinc dependent phospholipase C family protein [Halobacillus naozhouensis]|uniref:Zinc dependent phospholipase C family protein n=1 Tax=Halobacillus naozhouensis TaxID=554880 RepID=A0ABY8J3N2_9BACI|nr:zinc dependent phospholipase C family protein [Halobacillus naozhouensis]WFT76044.1 zinc dependent phospholipase C family protein [Halobacillus naozhouensis]